MGFQGSVREWHDDEGWGVIDSAATPGGCWVHFSAVLVPGYRELHTAQEVEFTFEPAEQDGYAFRALAVWPPGEAPVRNRDVVQEPSSAYRSTLTLTFDTDDDGARPS